MITTIDSIANVWLQYMGYAVVQNTIFLSIVLLILYLVRHAGARIQYTIGIIGILKLLIPPFLPLTFSSGSSGTGTIILNTEISILAAEPAKAHLTFIGLLFMIWCSTLFLYLVYATLCTMRMKWRLLRASFVESYRVDDFIFDIYQSPNISVPMSIGICPKRIYVPSTWAALDSDQQNVLLRHEIAHIKRWDGLFHIFQILAQAIYFFHPLVWLLNERLNEYREMACDDLAVERSSVTPLTYSRYLVHVAENMLPTWSTSSASALIKQRNKLYHRVNYQVKESTMKNISKRKSRLVRIVLFLLILPLSWYCKSNEPPPPQEAGEEKQNDAPAMVGKIWGQVTDAKTAEPLPGANVRLVGTSKGAATDMEGRFYIVNVPPGLYQLDCSFIGYASVLYDDVRVAVNQSTKIDFKLKTAIIQGEKLSVTAKKPGSADADEQIFIPYDEPPLPVGGWAAVRKNLVYPELARKAGVEGIVTVSVHINAKGKVIETKIEKSLGDNGCDEAAVAAIKKAKWKPAKQRGKPVAAWISLPVEFTLR